jgi:hypothetical protein
MTETEEETLFHFYDLLFSNIKKKKIGIKRNSVFITLIEATQSNVLQLISNSSIPGHTLSAESVSHLLEQKLIKKSDEGLQYLITARGIWAVEREKNIINETMLLDYFESKKFSIPVEKIEEFEYREKVIIFSLIAVRAFSKQSWANVSSQDGLQDYWKVIFDMACQKLVDLDVITEKNKTELYYRSVHDPPAVSLLRRVPGIQPRSKFIYQHDSSLHYWLEMPESADEFISKLAWLLSMIFKDKLTFDNFDTILNFCQEMSHDKSIYVFDLSQHKFSNPKYDELLQQAISKGIKGYRE